MNDKQTVNGLGHKAYTLMELQKWEEALVIWKEVRERDDSIAPAYIQAGIALRSLKKYDEAIELFNQSIKLHPQAINNLVHKAYTLMELQKWEEALVIWKEVRERDNSIAPAYIQAEFALTKLGWHDEIDTIYCNLINTIEKRLLSRPLINKNDLIKYFSLTINDLFYSLYYENQENENIFLELNSQFKTIYLKYIKNNIGGILDYSKYEINQVNIKNIIPFGVTEIQDYIFEYNELYIYSPITNNKLVSRKIIVINDFLFAYLFIEKGTPIFLFFEKHIPTPVLLFTPNENQAYIFDNKTDYKNCIYLLIEHSIENNLHIKKYLSTNTAEAVGWIRNGHIGHHLWNDLTAIDRLLKKKTYHNMKELIVLNHNKTEIYGKIEDIFKTTDLHINRNINNSTELASYIYENNYFGIRLGDNYITKSLIDKIKCYSHKQNKSIDKINLDTSKKSLKILIGLRFENRTWINQIDGIIEIIEYLGKKHQGKIQVIIDGHNISKDFIPMQSHMENKKHSIMDLEIMAFNKIKNKINNEKIEIISGIGLPISENLCLIDDIDFFIAPWGAGLAKYKWYANKNGIIFSSAYNLKNKPDLRIYELEKFREGATACLYVEEEYINDIDSHDMIIGTHESDTYRKNFFVNPKGIFEKIDLLLEKYYKEELL